jgi:hypothetical protein
MHNRLVGAATALTLATLAPCAGACPPQAAPGEPSAATQFAAIRSDHQKATEAFEALYKDAKTDEEKQQLFKDKYPKGDDYAARVVAVAKKAPKDASACETLVWVLGIANEPGATSSVLEVLTAQFIDDPKLGEACRQLQYNSTTAAETFLNNVLAASPHREVKGRACYSLAKVIAGHASLALRVQAEPDGELKKRLTEHYGVEMVDRLAKADATKLSQRAEQLLEDVVAQYGDLDSYRSKLGKVAENDLFELRNLSVGKPAPEIEGEDVDGHKFKLSEYRGKVVFLDFWGFW